MAFLRAHLRKFSAIGGKIKLQTGSALALVSASLFVAGCLPNYLVRSGYEQFKILDDREPITEVLKRKDLPPDQRRKLELALEVRKFATENLGLKATNNYRTFVDLKRPYVSWIVTAAKKYELTSYLYWYPLVGKLPYKGFFTKADAEEEANSFSKNEYDTMVRGVSAYSTLGWFDDPILSSMLQGEDFHLVNIIIHESTHATLYIKKSEADFNEQLATFVGNIGTELFYLQKEGPNSPTLVRIADEEKDDMVFSQFINQEIKNLQEWYKSNPHPDDELREKQFALIKERFLTDIKPKMKTDNYDGFAKSKLNNAVILYFKTYLNDLGDFKLAYEHFGKDIKKFLNFCKSLEKSPKPAQALKELTL